jgi:hypothetical protein
MPLFSAERGRRRQLALPAKSIDMNKNNTPGAR